MIFWRHLRLFRDLLIQLAFSRISDEFRVILPRFDEINDFLTKFTVVSRYFDKISEFFAIYLIKFVSFWKKIVIFWQNWWSFLYLFTKLVLFRKFLKKIEGLLGCFKEVCDFSDEMNACFAIVSLYLSCFVIFFLTKFAFILQFFDIFYVFPNFLNEIRD